MTESYELHITVSVLKNQTASLQEEIENMKIQTPTMSIKDIINDTEKVSYINGVMNASFCRIIIVKLKRMCIIKYLLH